MRKLVSRQDAGARNAEALRGPGDEQAAVGQVEPAGAR